MISFFSNMVNNFIPKQTSNFPFSKLIDDSQIQIISFLGFRELARFSSTCRLYKNILKFEDEGIISPYLKFMLLHIKCLKLSDIETCLHLTHISEITFIFKECLNLTTLEITTKDILNKNLGLEVIKKSCPKLNEIILNGERFDASEILVESQMSLLGMTLGQQSQNLINMSWVLRTLGLNRIHL